MGNTLAKGHSLCSWPAITTFSFLTIAANVGTRSTPTERHSGASSPTIAHLKLDPNKLQQARIK
jgi:hypothetical protein